MFFFGYGPGLFFVFLGIAIILGGIKRPHDRKRLALSGVASIVVGLGNLMLPHNWIAGLAIVAIGLYVVLAAARMRH
jgi:hypothetical protein